MKSFVRPLKVLFYGSDLFSVATLRVLNEAWTKNAGIEKLSVVTGLKKPPNHVHVFAEKMSIPYSGWPVQNDGTFDIGVVVSFSHLIPSRIIESFPL